MKAAQKTQEKTLQQIVDQYIVPGSKVECNGYGSYLNLGSVQLDRLWIMLRRLIE